MSPAAKGWRFLGRVDVRLGLGLIGAIGGLLVVLMSIFFFVSTHETVEILEGVLDDELAAATARFDDGAPPREALPGVPGSIAIRKVDAGGEIEVVQGEWPSMGRTFQSGSSSLRLALADEHAHLVSARALPHGGRLEAALSLREFVHERREQVAQILLSFGLSALALVAVSLTATRIALAPLRAATRAVEAIDEQHLDARLPLRGTGDDMDRCSRALNRVLQRLQDAFQRMSAFSADVAHELRTPVNRMLNLADVALLRPGEEEATADLIALREAAEDMRRLIENLLLLAKGEEGRLAIRRETIALQELAGDVLELFAPICEDRAIDLSLLLPPDDAKILGDRSLLQRAISNLLDNSVRHTPAGGKIEVAVTAGDASVGLAVSDSGPGIPEVERERVFDRFVQLDESRADDGAGLGLALVRMIARLQGGDVGAERSPLGGACLRITLPRFTDAPAPGPTFEQRPPA